MAGGAASTATSAAATIVLVLEWLLITGRVLPLGIGSHAAGKGFPRLSWGRPNRSLRRERAGGAMTVGSGEGLPACSWPVHEGSPSTASRWSRSEARRLSACKAAWLRLGLVPDPRQMAARSLVKRSQGWPLGGAPNAEGIDRHESRPGGGPRRGEGRAGPRRRFVPCAMCPSSHPRGSADAKLLARR